MTGTRRPTPGRALACLIGVAAAFAAAGPARGQALGAADEVRWLERHSMLRRAREAAAAVSGKPEQWRHPYGTPQPREAVRHASVWLLDFPGSVVTQKGKSVVATW